MTAESIRAEIQSLVARYHDAAFEPTPFVAGETPVPVSGRVFDGHELALLIDASLDFWLTTGRFADEFEPRFAAVMRRFNLDPVRMAAPAGAPAAPAQESPR